MKYIEGYGGFLNEDYISSNLVVRLYKMIKEIYSLYGDRKRKFTTSNYRKLLNKYDLENHIQAKHIRLELLTESMPHEFVVKVPGNEIDDLEAFTIKLYLKIFVKKRQKSYGTIKKISKLTAMLDKEAEQKANRKPPVVDKTKTKAAAIKAKQKKDTSNIVAIIQYLDSVIDDNNIEQVRQSLIMFLKRNNLAIFKYLEFMLNTYVRINDDKYEVLPKFKGMTINKIAENIYEEL